MKNFKAIISFLAAAVMTVSFSGCSSTGGSSSTGEVVYYDNSENSYVAPEDAFNAAKENAVKTEGTLGTKADVNVCSVTVSNVVSLGMLQTDKGVKEGIALKFEVTNNGVDYIDTTWSDNIKITVDGQSDIMEFDMLASGEASRKIEDYKILSSFIKNGETDDGYIAFSAKPGWKEMTISYTPLLENGIYDEITYKITSDMVQPA